MSTQTSNLYHIMMAMLWLFHYKFISLMVVCSCYFSVSREPLLYVEAIKSVHGNFLSMGRTFLLFIIRDKVTEILYCSN